MRHEFTLFKRKGQKIWYFYYYDDGKRVARSMGKAKKYEAERAAEAYLDEQEHPRSRLKLRDYAKDFFIWDKCA
ncbi:MAG TPA: hypothetical protein ENI27_11005, partial [bacterium]|nr:hypothetical protein [bacterium]